MKILLRVAKEAKQYSFLLIIAAVSTLMLTAVNLIAPKFLTRLIDMVSAGLTPGDMKNIYILGLSLLGIYLLRVLFRYLSNYMAHYAAWNLVEKIRLKVYNTIQSFSMDYFRNHQTGDIMSRVINDTATFELLYAHILPETVTNSVTLIGVTVILCLINWQLALLTCLPIPLILLSGWLFSHKVRPNFRIMQKSQGELSAQLQDNISGMQEIQAFGQQEEYAGKVHSRARRFTGNMLRALNLSAVFHPGVEFLTAIGTVIVVLFGGYLSMRGRMSVADIVGFLLYLTLFYAPITGIAQLLESAQQALAGAERVIELLDTPVAVHDMPGAKSISRANGELSFEDVSFHYTPEAPVLKNVSFTAQPGEMVAIVGATGVGKSTLAQIAARFYDPVAGRVLLDGRDLKQITIDSLRANIAMVLQDTFLFNGTLAENIALAQPGAELEEIIAAAKCAHVHEDILALPDGYNTIAGERGAKLSGGQRQRIAIARAVLCDAPILILDEATASVDVQTEEHIQSAIQELAGTRTILIIAHRLSTVRRADKIFVFEQGRITQAGRHDELIKQDGLYARMCKVQESGASVSA